MMKENRILRQITVNDIRACELIVQSLMGEQVAPRRDFLDKKAHLANVEV